MENLTSNNISSSLVAREIYCVCFPMRDGLDALRSELTLAKKKFFTGGRRSVKAGKSEIVKGFDGKLKGKITRRSIYWRKSANGISLEEVFDQRNGYAVVTRDFRNIIVSRAYFDKRHVWVKSEYYEPWNAKDARVIFKPDDVSDHVERFDWDSEKKRYRSTLLYPVPYSSGTAEQSILNARFGEPQLIISSKEGDFCYCPKKEAEERLNAAAEISEGTIVLMPAWEVKDGTLSGDPTDEESNITFTSLEEYARVAEPKEDEPAPAELPTAPEADEREEFTGVETADEESAEAAPEPEEKSEEVTEQPVIENAPAIVPQGYQGVIREGVLSGHGRTEQPGGLTAYEGEFENGMRHGFGSYYYKDGNLCYAGFWKDDKKDGLGVSFRDTDHALHIANWKDGAPQGYVSLFDKDGNLRYSGKMLDGKKEGAGVSVDPENGAVFVSKWQGGENTGVTAVFDGDGNLIYRGELKDGKRHGHGTEFDINGGIVFDGEWRDGKYYNGILYQKNSDTQDKGVSWDM